MQIPTLLFHQVSNDPIRSAHGEDNTKEPWTSPAAFDALLGTLEAEGYHFVGMREAHAYLSGRLPASALPSRPLLLTFDDGYRSAWTSATRILRKHHATATMFFEGRLTDVNPGRLRTSDLIAMRDSGVWTLESHGWAGHSELVIDGKGTRTPYWYANLAWVPAKSRLETPGEFQARVREDLVRFRRTFEKSLHVPIDLFAYPSGEFGQNAALPPGGDPKTRLEAGHSNAADLTPRLIAAVREAGFHGAFAVSIPGVTLAASRADDTFALPRLGVGAAFNPTSLELLHSEGYELPEVTRDARFADCLALGNDGKRLWTASTQVPRLYTLDTDGKAVSSFRIEALLADRSSNPSLISGIIARGKDLTVVQQAGWWSGAHPQLTHLHVTGERASVIDRHVLPQSLNWTVGATRSGDRMLALTDDGKAFDLASGAPRFSIGLPESTVRNGRFAGFSAYGNRFVSFDRIAHALTVIGSDGKIDAAIPLDGDIRNLAVGGDRLSVLDAAGLRRIVKTYRIASGR